MRVPLEALGFRRTAIHFCLLVGLMVPAHRHVVERSDPASGKPQIDIALVFAELLGTIEELALLLFNPPGLRDHPFRLDRP